MPSPAGEMLINSLANGFYLGVGERGHEWKKYPILTVTTFCDNKTN